MENYLFIPFVMLFVVLVISRGLRIVREEYRLVVFRLGRFFRIAGPGLVYLVPHIDEAQLISLNDSIPHWLSLSQEQLSDEIRKIVLTGNLNSKK